VLVKIRNFKRWRKEYIGAYQSYIDIEYYCYVHLQVNEKIILDISDFKGMYAPFDNKILGGIRRYFYHRIVSRALKAEKLFKRTDQNFRILRRSRRYGFRPSFKPGASDIEKIDVSDLVQIHGFMIKNGVRFIALPYFKAGWTQLIGLMKSKGYKYIYGNARYILFSLEDVGSKND